MNDNNISEINLNYNSSFAHFIEGQEEQDQKQQSQGDEQNTKASQSSTNNSNEKASDGEAKDADYEVINDDKK